MKKFAAIALVVLAAGCVFNKYGDHYFLREIRRPLIAMNVELRQSRLEKQIRVQTASLGPETTLLALK